MGGRLESLATGTALPIGAVLLLAIRFAAPSATASLGVAGVDTSALNAIVGIYDGVLPAAAALLVAILLLTWPHALRVDRWMVLALLAVIGSLIAWVGEVDSAYRLVWGPWATLPLSLAVTAAIAAYGLALDRRVRDAGLSATARGGFRTLYAGYAIAYLVGSLRFVDYRYALGITLPPGALWLLNYAPTLLPSLVALYFWILLTWPPGRSAVGIMRFLGFPLLGAIVGVVIAQGLGGFILSNMLAWGGAYEVFVPTTISLALVGFAVGSFVATGWTLRGRLPGTTWRFVVGGVAATALAGVLFFDGALASLAGILLGLTLAGRGILGPTGLAGVDLGRRETASAAEYRE